MVKPPDLQYGPERKEHMKKRVRKKWHPHTVADIAAVVKKYPIGSKVRLTSDMSDYEPRTVQGYKQINNTMYLIFSDGHAACIERIANGKKSSNRKGMVAEMVSEWQVLGTIITFLLAFAAMAAMPEE